MSLFFARKREKISPEARRTMQGDWTDVFTLASGEAPKKDTHDRESFVGIACFFGAMIAMVALFWVAFSHEEAAAYRRVTGKSVSTLDAMFLDLRVQEAVK